MAFRVQPCSPHAWWEVDSLFQRAFQNLSVRSCLVALRSGREAPHGKEHEESLDDCLWDVCLLLLGLTSLLSPTAWWQVT